MKIRGSIHLGGHSRSLVLFPLPGESLDRLFLKLAACVFFFEKEPIVDSGPKHPALLGQDYTPDLLVTDEAGGVGLWIECGKTTLNKLGKISRRFHQARILMLIGEPHEARQMSEGLKAEEIGRVEVWGFAPGEFSRWKHLVAEQNEIIGEATETSMNLVINEQTFMTDLERFL